MGLRFSSFSKISVGVLLLGLQSDSLCSQQVGSTESFTQPKLGHRSKPLLNVAGLQFRDLNGGGQLNPYEDCRLPAEARAHDLVSRMRLDEKIGLMVIGMQLMGNGSGAPTEGVVRVQKVLMDRSVKLGWKTQ